DVDQPALEKTRLISAKLKTRLDAIKRRLQDLEQPFILPAELKMVEEMEKTTVNPWQKAQLNKIKSLQEIRRFNIAPAESFIKMLDDYDQKRSPLAEYDIGSIQVAANFPVVQEEIQNKLAKIFQCSESDIVLRNSDDQNNMLVIAIKDRVIKQFIDKLPKQQDLTSELNSARFPQ